MELVIVCIYIWNLDPCSRQSMQNGDTTNSLVFYCPDNKGESFFTSDTCLYGVFFIRWICNV